MSNVSPNGGPTQAGFLDLQPKYNTAGLQVEYVGFTFLLGRRRFITRVLWREHDFYPTRTIEIPK